jgi:hypothetical protein
MKWLAIATAAAFAVWIGARSIDLRLTAALAGGLTAVLAGWLVYVYLARLRHR